MTIAEAIQKAAAQLSAHKVPNARLDAEVLFCPRRGQGRAGSSSYAGHARRHACASSNRASTGGPCVSRFSILPVPGVLGLPFKVTPAVLIRVRDEFVVEAALKAQRHPARSSSDLGTVRGDPGKPASGLQQAQSFAVDRSEKHWRSPAERAANGVQTGRFSRGPFGPLRNWTCAVGSM